MCKCLSVFFVSNKKRDDDDVSRTCFVFRFNFTWFLVLKTKRIHCLFTSLILYACRLFLMTISLGHHPEIMTSTMMMMIVLGLCLLRKLLLQVSLFPFPFCPFNSRRGSCSASMINGYFLLVSSPCFFLSLNSPDGDCIPETPSSPVSAWNAIFRFFSLNNSFAKQEMPDVCSQTTIELNVLRPLGIKCQTILFATR